jgi:leucyl-tRNA synthetase
MSESERYDHASIEAKQRARWETEETYRTGKHPERPKFYALDMFPYPSGQGLHVGHPKGFIGSDVLSRFKRMNGFDVLHPMGFDAFGLPAENYAIKNKVHPRQAVDANIAYYKSQLSIIGFDYDWTRQIDTTDPKYYKWTQWIFLKLYEKGLAFQSYEPINWCPSCQTGLANEDIEDGKCERCETPVEKKPMRQWVLKITDYADRLLEDLDELDWPESIKESQRNWIGRSEGVNFKCTIKDLGIQVSMYNSVPQTYHAETFTVIAPDHPLVPTLVAGLPNEKEVLDFVEKIKERKKQNKFNISTDLEGIFTGRYIESFADTGRDLPIWIASYVVSDYGTGIVNCSAHDERDFAFAKKFNIPLKPVMFPSDVVEAQKVTDLEYAYCKDSEGVLKEPAQFAGRKWGEVRTDIIEHIVRTGLGDRRVNYKLRDWVFSRQRYWGEPIPLLHVGDEVVPVPEDKLPVELPRVESYAPTGTGESPLADIAEWVNTTAPDGRPARRETNTMPQWAGSSWYYLRYMDTQNDEALVSKDAEKRFAPVDVYVGGTEHATRHLIYARFWHKFLFDIGVVSTKEPFKRLMNQGLIMGEDGRKMGKRYGNVVNPDDVVAQHGADTFRMFEMFLGPFEQQANWSTASIMGPRRFIERLWKLQDTTFAAQSHEDVRFALAEAIPKISADIEAFAHNTAISCLMILLSTMEKAPELSKDNYMTLLKLVAPYAPHVTDEIWGRLGGEGSIHESAWPTPPTVDINARPVAIAVQVNGKSRGAITARKGATQDELVALVEGDESIAKWLVGERIRIIHVQDRMISFVIKPAA